jgi:hypothetical protein
MRSLLALLCSPLIGAVLAWLAVAACLDEPIASAPAEARVVVAWDPLACEDPHRVAVELRDDTGALAAASTPCSLGGLTVDVAHFGVYHGRVYAWASTEAPSGTAAVTTIELSIEQPIVRYEVATP